MDAKVATRVKRARKQPAERLPDTPDPVEIAMVAVASNKPIPSIARRVLEEQVELIRAQRLELRLKHVGDIVRAVLWTVFAIATLGVAIAVGTILYRASRTDALVVESFRVPPAMARQGLTGEVLATHILDKVAEVQSNTPSVRAASTYDNNWGDDLKIDIPNTGATAEQVWKLLRGWLGRETRISGEVVHSGETVSLTTRVGAGPGQRFTAKPGQLDSLIGQAAEHVLKETQPYRYSAYLSQTPGRAAEAAAILRRLTNHESETERKWAFNGLAADAAAAGSPRLRQMLARRALAIDPDMFPARSQIAYAALALGHDQQAADILETLMNAKPGKDYDPDSIATGHCRHQAMIALLKFDYQRLMSAADCSENDSAIASPETGPLIRAFAALIRHDPRPTLDLASRPSSQPPSVMLHSQRAEARLLGQIERGASPALSAELDSYREARARVRSSPDTGRFATSIMKTEDWPLEATALIILGRVDEASALIARTPADCYKCVRTRGLAAEARGDLNAAQRWFNEAVRQAPRLAPAYADWGRLLVRARRPDAAIVRLARAAELSPNWADPLKYWGDALVAQGRRDEAIAKYDAALNHAPKWQALRQARRSLD